MALLFNREETKGILKILIDLMKADDKITTHEVEFLSKMTKVLMVDKITLKEADSLTYEQAIEIIKPLGNQEKQSIFFLMLEMVNPQKERSDAANRMVFKVCADAGITLPNYGMK